MNKKIIDCDLHNTYAHQSNLYPYLSKHMIERIKGRGLGYSQEVYHKTMHNKRLDAMNDDGTTAGSSADKIKKDWIDKYNIDYAILTGEGIIGVSAMPNIDVACALSSAYNQYLVEEWLSKDQRFLGSLHLAIQNPEHAVFEINKWADHPQIVQVTLPIATTLPLSHMFYRPILKAIEETKLVLSLHFKQPTVNNYSSTPVGLLSSYYAWHSLVSLPYQTQLVDLISSGLFEELTQLKIVMLEGGYSWLPHLLWRMEHEYKALWQEIPKMNITPFEYLHKHFRFGTQPTESPTNPGHLEQIIEMIKGDELLIFAGDYPHWDAESPFLATKVFNSEIKNKILYNNAARWFNLK